MRNLNFRRPAGVSFPLLAAALGITFSGAAALTSAPAQASSDLYQDSYDREAAGDIAGALRSLAGIPAASPEAYTRALRIGWLRYLAGEHAPAIEAYIEASRLAPKAVEPLLGMMLPQMALRRWQDAERTARSVLQRNKHSYLARSRLAFTLYNLGRYEQSRKLYSAVLRDYPSKVDMRAGLAWCLWRLGRSAEAMATFQSVLSVAPKQDSALEGVRTLSARGAAQAGK